MVIGIVILLNVFMPSVVTLSVELQWILEVLI